MSSASATSRNSEWPLKSALRTLSHLTRAPSRFPGCKSCGTCLLSRPFQSASSPAPHGPLSSRSSCSSFNSVALLSPHCGDVALKRLKRHRKASRRPRFVVDLGANVRPVNKAKAAIQASAIMTHPKLVVVLAAMLFVGSAGTALAQGTGGARAPSPGIGGGGIGGGGGTF